MQLATTVKTNGMSFAVPRGILGLEKRCLTFFMLLAVAAIGLFAGGDASAAIPTSELTPLTTKASDWAIAIAAIGLLIGLGFGFGKAATTNRWEPALQPIGLAVLWGVGFAIVGVGIGAPILI